MKRKLCTFPCQKIAYPIGSTFDTPRDAGRHNVVQALSAPPRLPVLLQFLQQRSNSCSSCSSTLGLFKICLFNSPPPSPWLRMKNLVIFKVYCNTFVVTFQCSEISLTSSESKQDETKLDNLDKLDNHILAISPSKLIIIVKPKSKSKYKLKVIIQRFGLRLML